LKKRERPTAPVLPGGDVHWITLLESLVAGISVTRLPSLKRHAKPLPTGIFTPMMWITVPPDSGPIAGEALRRKTSKYSKRSPDEMSWPLLLRWTTTMPKWWDAGATHRKDLFTRIAGTLVALNRHAI
jgi:hypothetical protein